MSSGALPPTHPDASALLSAELSASPAGDVLVIGRQAGVTVEATGRRLHRCPEPAHWRDLPCARRYAVGLAVGALDRIAEDEARQLLARLRDQLCRRVLVLVAPGSSWDRNRLLGLGYTLRGRAEGPGGTWRLYDHDVGTYNPERSWNNPDHWAHPENHRRFRW